MKEDVYELDGLSIVGDDFSLKALLRNFIEFPILIGAFLLSALIFRCPFLKKKEKAIKDFERSIEKEPVMMIGFDDSFDNPVVQSSILESPRRNVFVFSFAFKGGYFAIEVPEWLYKNKKNGKPFIIEYIDGLWGTRPHVRPLLEKRA